MKKSIIIYLFFVLEFLPILLQGQNKVDSKLEITVYDYNKSVSTKSDLKFTLKIKNNSTADFFLPADYNCTIKGGNFGNIAYEVVFLSEDTNRTCKVRQPLISGFFKPSEDSFLLKMGSNYLISIKDFDFTSINKKGKYKIRFFSVENPLYYKKIPDFKTDWVYFELKSDIYDL